MFQFLLPFILYIIVLWKREDLFKAWYCMFDLIGPGGSDYYYLSSKYRDINKKQNPIKYWIGYGIPVHLMNINYKIFHFVKNTFDKIFSKYHIVDLRVKDKTHPYYFPRGTYVDSRRIILNTYFKLINDYMVNEFKYVKYTTQEDIDNESRLDVKEILIKRKKDLDDLCLVHKYFNIEVRLNNIKTNKLSDEYNKNNKNILIHNMINNHLDVVIAREIEMMELCGKILANLFMD